MQSGHRKVAEKLAGGASRKAGETTGNPDPQSTRPGGTQESIHIASCAYGGAHGIWFHAIPVVTLRSTTG